MSRGQFQAVAVEQHITSDVDSFILPPPTDDDVLCRREIAQNYPIRKPRDPTRPGRVDVDRQAVRRIENKRIPVGVVDLDSSRDVVTLHRDLAVGRGVGEIPHGGVARDMFDRIAEGLEAAGRNRQRVVAELAVDEERRRERRQLHGDRIVAATGVDLEADERSANGQW